MALDHYKDIEDASLNKINRLEEENKIISLLKKEETKDLQHDIKLAPVWIQKIMKKAVENGEH